MVVLSFDMVVMNGKALLKPLATHLRLVGSYWVIHGACVM